MKSAIYIETSIIGYLTTRLSNLLVAAAYQQITRQWWEERREQFELFISQFVVDECSSGDSTAAVERLEKLSGIARLDVTDEVIKFADVLRWEVPLPEKAKVDSYHVAVAAVNGVQFLLTWNCKHIANASLRPRIEEICRAMDTSLPSFAHLWRLMEM